MTQRLSQILLYSPSLIFFFFFNDTATTEIYTLSLHDALPIQGAGREPILAGHPPSPAAAIGPVSYHRVPDVGEMHPNLVGPAGGQADAQEVTPAVPRDGLQVRHGRPPARHDAHALAILHIPPDGRVHVPRFVEVPPGERRVGALDAAEREGVGKFAVRVVGLGDN